MPVPWDQPLAYLISDLSGGLNNTVSELKTGREEATLADNVDLDVDGKVVKRRGATKLNASPVAAAAKVNGMVHFKPTLGTARYVAAIGDGIYEWNSSTSSWDLLYSTIDVDATMLFVPFKNLLYMQNGIDGPLVYAPDVSGTPKVFKPGQPKPATDPTVNSAISGSMPTSGVIKIRVRYVSPISNIFFGEPAPDDTTGLEYTLTASGGVKINIPVYPGGSAPDYRVGGRVIERTKANGAIFYLDGYVSDNTTTTYDITQSDAALEANDIMPALGYREPMPILYPFISFARRIVGFPVSELGLLYYSEIDAFGILPESFPFNEYNFHRIDVEDELDRPEALARLGDYLQIYCGRSIHTLRIDEENTSYARRLGGYDVGVPGPRCALEIPDGNIVWTFKGPYLRTHSQFTHIGERIEGALEGLPKGNLGQLYMVHLYDKRQVKVYLPGASGSSAQNDAAFVYHYRRQSLNPDGFPTRHAWSVHKGFFARSGMVVRDDSTKLDSELSGDYNGTVYTVGVGDTDAREPVAGYIEAEYRTGWLDFDFPQYVKNFEELWVFTDLDAAGSLNVAWQTDFGNGPDGEAALEAGTESMPAIVGTAVVGTAVVSGGEHIRLHTHLGEDGVNAFGTHLRLRFYQDTADQTVPWSIIAVVVKYSLSRERSDRVG